MAMPDAIDDILQKHIDFWHGNPVREPLIQRIDFSGWRPKPYPVTGGTVKVEPARIEPEDIDVERLLNLDCEPRSPVTGNLVNGLGCLYPEAWMEGLIGCPIYVSAYSCSAKPVADAGTRECPDPRWAKVMDTVLEKARQTAGNRIAVRPLHLRGVIDMLAAYFGEERLCMLACDDDQEMQTLARTFTDLFMATARRSLDLRRLWRGGLGVQLGALCPRATPGLSGGCVQPVLPGDV